MPSLPESRDILNGFLRQFVHNLTTTYDTRDSLRIWRQLATHLRQLDDSVYNEYAPASAQEAIHAVAGRAFGYDHTPAHKLSQIALDVADILVQRFLKLCA
jgi:hypothetical protein